MKPKLTVDQAREQTRERDGNRCQWAPNKLSFMPRNPWGNKCGGSERLEVHHMCSGSWKKDCSSGGSSCTDMSHLVTVCRRHHELLTNERRLVFYEKTGQAYDPTRAFRPESAKSPERIRKARPTFDPVTGLLVA